MKGYKFILFIQIIFFLFGISSVCSAQENGKFKELAPEEFYIKMNREMGSVVIDTRLVQDYYQDRIPGALPASEPEELKSLTDTLDKETPLLVYCYDGDRSKTACKILTGRLGFKNVYNLKKGLEMWEKMKLPMDTTELKPSSVQP